MADVSQLKVSISRPSFGDERERIEVRIRDPISRLPVVHFEMTLDDFARCLTGLSEVPAQVSRFPSQEERQNLGRFRRVKDMFCERVSDKEQQRRIALANVPEGWELNNDGCSTQQRGDHHRFTICQWRDLEE